MILSVRINNFLVYANPTELSLIADMRIKKFYSNVFQQNNFNVVKSACIYGGNNVGKSCIIRAIGAIRNVLLGRPPIDIKTNLFTDNQLCSLGISFIYKGKAYSYDFTYDTSSINHYRKGFVYERFAEITIDKLGNEYEHELFVRDIINNKYIFKNSDKNSDGVIDLRLLLNSLSSDNILIYSINSEIFPIIEVYKHILRGFALNVTILDTNNMPIEKTIQILKENKDTSKRIVELIKFADLDIDDYKYEKSIKPRVSISVPADAPQELIINQTVAFEDMFKLTSFHKGKPVQSLIYDSTGTKKIVALASYIIETLKCGKILVVDELDGSLHFKLTRAIVSLFNNELNTNAQLIFTAHDGTLLDTRKLFRKDQIYFADKNDNGAFLKSLSNYTAKEDNVRSCDDILEKYKLGVFGALPEPDLINILLGDEENE